MQEVYGGAGGQAAHARQRRQEERLSILSNCEVDLISLCRADGELQGKHCPPEALGRNARLSLRSPSHAQQSLLRPDTTSQLWNHSLRKEDCTGGAPPQWLCLPTAPPSAVRKQTLRGATGLLPGGTKKRRTVHVLSLQSALGCKWYTSSSFMIIYKFPSPSAITPAALGGSAGVVVGSVPARKVR